ncbi:MAG: four helix bundle protein [bacterium]|nr:four helix bundle protein [bacterium]
MTTENRIESYRDLVVWQKSIELVIAVYKITAQYPSTELYGITSQSRRAVVSIPSNIAEGKRRGSRKDFRHFLIIAFGSGAELETQIEIVKRLPFGKNLSFKEIDVLLDEVMRMLNRLIETLKD